jgi:hypothetical protein
MQLERASRSSGVRDVTPRVCALTVQRGLLALLVFLAAAGCGPLAGSTVAEPPRTAAPSGDGLNGASYLVAGDRILVFAAAPPPADAVDLGPVDVAGTGFDADVDELMQELAAKVHATGANAVALGDVAGGFIEQTQPLIEVATAPCGYRGVCMQRRATWITIERPHLVLRGRALRVQVAR